jgi:signal recognition particle subunit SRP54
VFRRQQAIISSMTKLERKKPDILAASRKRRIAAGSGVDVAEINRLLKQHRQMADVFKSMSKNGGKGMAQMARQIGMGGGGGGGPPSRLSAAARCLARRRSRSLARNSPVWAGRPDLSKLPGLGGGLPPGFNPFKK